MTTVASPAESRREALLLAAVVTLGIAHAVVYALPFEDSFITFRYAENLARGDGLVWNPGERVEGCSSFLWTVLLAGVSRLGIPLPGTAVLLSLLASVALLILTRALGVRRGLSPELATLAAALVAAQGTFAYFGASGMETALFSLAVCSAAWFAKDKSNAGALRTGVTLGLATWIRPEGFGYLGVFALAALLDARDRVRSLRILAVGLATAAPLVGFRLWYFGYLLPNTSYAKATPSFSLLQTGGVYALNFLVGTGFGLSAAAALRLAFRGELTRSDRLASLIAFAATANAVLVGGDTFGFFRTFLPALAPSAVLLVRGFGGAPSAPGHAPSPPAIRLVPAVALLWAASAAFLPRVSPGGVVGSDFSASRGVATINRDYFLVGQFLSDTLPKNATIAVNAAGIVPYVSGLRALDMLGLNDVHIAHRPVKPGESGAIGHQKHDAAYVLGKRPDVILPGLPVISPNALRPEDVGGWYAQWARYLPGDRELFANPDLALFYRPVVVPLGDGYFPLLVRRAGVF